VGVTVARTGLLVGGASTGLLVVGGEATGRRVGEFVIVGVVEQHSRKTPSLVGQQVEVAQQSKKTPSLFEQQPASSLLVANAGVVGATGLFVGDTGVGATGLIVGDG
jgi:hypothetical protein